MSAWLLCCTPGPLTIGACVKCCKDIIDEEQKVEFNTMSGATGSNEKPSGAQALIGPGDGKMQWRPKMCYEDGRKYEGQWLGDFRHGRGREESRFGDFTYDGEFQNDKYEGQGIMAWANGSRYTGQFVNNLKHGKGREWYGQGDRYQGEYKNGNIDGRGEYVKSDGTSIKGMWSQGQLVKTLKDFGSSFTLGASFAEHPPPMPAPQA